MIDSFSYITQEVVKTRQNTGVNVSEIASMNRFDKFQVFAVGVTPQVFDVTKDQQFMSVYYDNSGLKIGEQLYTARGSQGGVMSSYMVKKTETDPNYPDSIFGKLFLFIFNDAKKNVIYS